MIYYEKFEMTLAASPDLLNRVQSTSGVGFLTVPSGFSWIFSKINQPERKLTDEEKRNILYLTLSWNEENFNNLTDKEKLRILNILFEWEEERLEGLSDHEKINLIRKLFLWEESNTLTIDERHDILMKLFWLKEWELDSSFLYKWNWAELYEKICNDKSYPFIDIENEYLENLRRNEKFMKILKNTDFITDVGCGDGQKIISLLW